MGNLKEISQDWLTEEWQRHIYGDAAVDEMVSIDNETAIIICESPNWNLLSTSLQDWAINSLPESY